jgi:hypothetical protein
MFLSKVANEVVLSALAKLFTLLGGELPSSISSVGPSVPLEKRAGTFSGFRNAGDRSVILTSGKLAATRLESLMVGAQFSPYRRPVWIPPDWAVATDARAARAQTRCVIP